ncbi:sulfotransferase domain-containing protein [Phenylobacterium sp.]|uniref:sulfotransferase domain-containing protein n=1 Tax=Phenylobacterium sp. TaxID=1871053 RepID=UPI002F419EE1
MNAISPVWPVKTEEHDVAIIDSTRWDHLAFREDDIVIATYAKCGTTLTQQIVSQLVFDADPSVYGAGFTVSPCLEMQPPGVDFLATLEAQTHRRFIKTHLPVRQLTYSPRARYITVGRDVRDIVWSFHNHQRGMRADLVEIINRTAGRPFIDAEPDVRDFYHRFLDEGGSQGMPFWRHIQGWWDIRGLPNLLTLHYADLIGDMPGQFRKIAAFLDIPLDEAKLPLMLQHCSLEHMRNVATADGGPDIAFDRGPDTFINKGTNGRWRDVLTPAEIARADEVAARELTPDCAAWLRDGTWPAA